MTCGMHSHFLIVRICAIAFEGPSLSCLAPKTGKGEKCWIGKSPVFKSPRRHFSLGGVFVTPREVLQQRLPVILQKEQLTIRLQITNISRTKSFLLTLAPARCSQAVPEPWAQLLAVGLRLMDG